MILMQLVIVVVFYGIFGLCDTYMFKWIGPSVVNVLSLFRTKLVA